MLGQVFKKENSFQRKNTLLILIAFGYHRVMVRESVIINYISCVVG